LKFHNPLWYGELMGDPPNAAAEMFTLIVVTDNEAGVKSATVNDASGVIARIVIRHHTPSATFPWLDQSLASRLYQAASGHHDPDTLRKYITPRAGQGLPEGMRQLIHEAITSYLLSRRPPIKFDIIYRKPEDEG
jgi:hypothetical protein